MRGGLISYGSDQVEPRVQDADRRRGAQRLGEQRRALPVVPRAMIAPGRVMMRDSPCVYRKLDSAILVMKSAEDRL